jgi:hypothetical protein
MGREARGARPKALIGGRKEKRTLKKIKILTTPGKIEKNVTSLSGIKSCSKNRIG